MIILNEPQPNNHPLVIAHRGSTVQAHENTLDAFERAILDGADAVEIDVRRTVDGNLIIHHDRCISGNDVTIRNQTYKEILRLSQEQGYHVPTLQETIQLCKDRIALDVEVKEEGYEAEIVDMVLSSYYPKYAVFTSFSDTSVLRLKESGQEVTAGLLLGLPAPVSLGTRFKEIFPEWRLQTCRANFVAPHWKLLKFGFSRRMRSRKIPIWVWTVDDASVATRLARNGISAIITNRTAQIRDVVIG